MSVELDIGELWSLLKHPDSWSIMAVKNGSGKGVDITAQVENALSEIDRLNLILKTCDNEYMRRPNNILASREQAEHSAQSAHALYEMHELKDNLDRLEHAITELRVELTRATACLMSHAGATKNDIDKLGCKIMSAISEWKTQVDQTFDEIDTKLDTATGKLTGLTDDVAFLKETIDKLQTNPGPITPEDQALLDAAQARVNSLYAKATAVSTALEALDAATERPTAPPLPA